MPHYRSHQSSQFTYRNIIRWSEKSRWANESRAERAACFSSPTARVTEIVFFLTKKVQIIEMHTQVGAFTNVRNPNDPGFLDCYCFPIDSTFITVPNKHKHWCRLNEADISPVTISLTIFLLNSHSQLHLMWTDSSTVTMQARHKLTWSSSTNFSLSVSIYHTFFPNSTLPLHLIPISPSAISNPTRAPLRL